MLEPHLSGKMLFMFLLLAKRTMQLPLCICADFVWPLRDTANSLFLRKKKKKNGSILFLSPLQHLLLMSCFKVDWMYRPVDFITCNLKSACRFVEVRKRAGFEHLFPALFLHYLDISDSFNQMQCYEFSLWRDCVKVYSVTSYKPVLFHSLLSMCITCV